MNQAEKERAVFLEFVPASGLTIDPESVKSRNPPAPDIVCEISGRGRVGFELTELIDQDFMARLSLLGKTKRHLSETWKSKLSDEDSSEFQRKYSNALLHFVYEDGATLRDREGATIIALQALLALADGIEGAIPGPPELSPVIREVRISRGTFSGPILDVDSFGWLGDPTSEACRKKLSKHYECDYPIELLAYVEFDLLPPEGAWQGAIEELSESFTKSQFEKVWVFDRGSQSVTYKMSPAGAA